MHHYRKTIHKYKHLAHSDKKAGIGCGLCEAIAPAGIIEETKHLRLIKNRVPYDMFDGLETTGEHYLIVPRRHVLTIGDFTKEELLEMIELIAKYEPLGFSVYARSASNVHRSQPHQHTHLIQLITKEPRFFVATNRPYMLFHG